jgi:hypothetical protein
MVAPTCLALHYHLQGAFLVPSERCSIEEQSIEYCGWTCVSSDMVRAQCLCYVTVTMLETLCHKQCINNKFRYE